VSPPHFFLFPEIKRSLKGHRFDDIPDIQRAVTKALTGITPADYSGPMKLGKRAGNDVSTPKATTSKNFNVLYKSDQYICFF